MAFKKFTEFKDGVTAGDVVNAMSKDIKGLENIPHVLKEGEPTTTGRAATQADVAQSLQQAGSYIVGDSEIKQVFLDGLWLRIGKTFFNSRIYNDKLTPLDKGDLPQGWTVQEIYNGLIKPVQYSETSATYAEDVYKPYNVETEAAYYHVNWQHLYPATTYDKNLEMAFLSPDGLAKFINNIITQIYTSLHWDEELSKRYVIARYIVDGGIKVIDIPNLTAANGTFITRKIKEIFNDVTSMSSGYNAAGVKNFSNPDDMFLIVTNAYDAAYTVDVQASAFNLDKVSYLGRRVLVKSFSFDADEIAELNLIFKDDPNYKQFTDTELQTLANVQAVICDRDFTQFYDKLTEFTTAYNKAHLFMNYFYHKWKILFLSPFAQAAAFISSEVGVVSVSVSPATVTIQKGQFAQLTANVVTTGFAPKSVVWEIEQPTNASFVSETGIVQIGTNETRTSLTVKVTSSVDLSKYATCTINITG